MNLASAESFVLEVVKIKSKRPEDVYGDTSAKNEVLLYNRMKKGKGAADNSWMGSGELLPTLLRREYRDHTIADPTL